MFSTPFHRDWIKLSVRHYSNVCEISDDVFNWVNGYGYSRYWNRNTLRRMMLDSTVELKGQLGSNPVIALSGGIDSQVACLAMKEAGAKFKVAILKFNDDWNYQDAHNAEYFCKVNGLDYRVYELEIFDFLQRDLRKYVSKYSCPSPQLCCHHWLLEQIKTDGASGILLGGDVPSLDATKTWQFAMSRSQSSWIDHQKINDIVIRSWKSWSKEIAMAFILTTDSDPSRTFYQNKVNSSLALGFDIIPQTDKKNGFELIKKYFEQQTGNGWTFELLYRHPNYSLAPEHKSLVVAPKPLTDCILEIKNRILNEINN
jgi:hypothetical protein